MKFDNYVFTVMVLLLAFFVASILTKRIDIPIERERDTQLDGLRGLLALAVFICHVAAWYNYIHKGSYMQSGPGLYSQLSKVSVFMFFMITGYLFIGKILRERKKGIDWTQFAISRILRIAPLYFFVVFSMLFIVFLESDFEFQESMRVMIPDILQWVAFTVFKTPMINNYENTSMITSHVQWTLVYEWIFYLSLPFVALAMNVRVPILYLIATFLLLASIYFNADHLFLPTGFIGGALTAIICSKYVRIKEIVVKPIFSVIAIGLLFVQGIFFPEFAFIQPSRYSAALICVSFLIIAAGNSLFGLLTTNGAKYLGKISYSIYLMHGITLFVTFKFIVGLEYAASLSRINFGLLIFAITVLVILVSSVTYYAIEEPAMKQVKRLTHLFKTTFQRDLKESSV